MQKNHTIFHTIFHTVARPCECVKSEKWAIYLRRSGLNRGGVESLGCLGKLVLLWSFLKLLKLLKLPKLPTTIRTAQNSRTHFSVRVVDLQRSCFVVGGSILLYVTFSYRTRKAVNAPL